MTRPISSAPLFRARTFIVDGAAGKEVPVGRGGQIRKLEKGYIKRLAPFSIDYLTNTLFNLVIQYVHTGWRATVLNILYLIECFSFHRPEAQLCIALNRQASPACEPGELDLIIL